VPVSDLPLININVQIAKRRKRPESGGKEQSAKDGDGKKGADWQKN